MYIVVFLSTICSVLLLFCYSIIPLSHVNIVHMIMVPIFSFHSLSSNSGPGGSDGSVCRDSTTVL